MKPAIITSKSMGVRISLNDDYEAVVTGIINYPDYSKIDYIVCRKRKKNG
jgi:hypothetical protein